MVEMTMWECEKCGKRFKNKSDSQKHERTCKAINKINRTEVDKYGPDLGQKIVFFILLGVIIFLITAFIIYLIGFKSYSDAYYYILFLISYFLSYWIMFQPKWLLTFLSKTKDDSDKIDNIFKIEEKLRKDVLDPFYKRYGWNGEALEKLSDLVNMIKYKKKMELTKEEAFLVLRHYQREKIINIFYDALTHLKPKNSESLAKLYVKKSNIIKSEYTYLLGDNYEDDMFLEDNSDLDDEDSDSDNTDSEEEIYVNDVLLDLFFESLDRHKVEYDKDEVLNLIEEVHNEVKADEFERKLKANQEEEISIYDVENYDGHKFEHFCAELFRRQGYEVRETKKTGDQGADLIIKKEGVSTAVQCKRYNKNVDNGAIQEVVGSLKHYDCDNGIVITTSEFTRSAIELARKNNIKLINHDELEELIDKYF